MSTASFPVALLVAHRAYFAVVLCFTAWVGWFGFFRPDEILRALSWPVPPLHARFIGALYLSATLFLALSLIARSIRQVRFIVAIAFAWTGWLLLITFIHWSTFDFTRPQPWFWVVAYVAFPVAAAALAWRSRATGSAGSTGSTDASAGRRNPRAVSAFFAVQGAVFTLVGALCFVAPDSAGRFWPWTISPFLAQVYSGPLLGYGIGGLLIARAGDREGSAIPAAGLCAFALLALVASLRHLGLFTAGSPSAIVWFGALGLLALSSAAAIAASLRRDGPEAS